MFIKFHARIDRTTPSYHFLHSLVLVAICKAVILRQLFLLSLLERHGEAHQELATHRQPHEHMILQVAIGNDVSEAETQSIWDGFKG